MARKRGGHTQSLPLATWSDVSEPYGWSPLVSVEAAGIGRPVSGGEVAG